MNSVFKRLLLSHTTKSDKITSVQNIFAVGKVDRLSNSFSEENQMKKLLLLIALVFLTGIYSNINAQAPTVSTPAVTGDTTLRDDSIRMRSIDLERAKQDAAKSNRTSDTGATASINTEIDKKYPQIKEDFEGIQTNQTVIINAYTTGESINYKQIKLSADEINKSAKRLDGNLFAERDETKKAEKEKDKKTKEIKDLIVELDNAIGNFVASPMFQNLRVVDPEVAGKAQTELIKITQISELLSKEADKMK